MQNKVMILSVAPCGKAVEVSKGSTWSQVPVCSEDRQICWIMCHTSPAVCRLPLTPIAKLRASARIELGFLMCCFEECYRADF